MSLFGIQQDRKDLETSVEIITKVGMASFLMFAVDNHKSFDTLGTWMVDIKKNCTSEDVPVVLVGNKADLPKVVTDEEVKSLAEKYHIPYFYASAKTSVGVDEAIIALIERVLKTKKDVDEDIVIIAGNSRSSTTEPGKQPSHSGGCC
eukprot:gnl/Chilomastix_caulleri/1708.p1 GENE.gnl/Chilomastix_caulleri/1708~~gnl/Chilomastix_caulleri/1708.p1  ORF type:complete len:148 (+),score=27.93 gnl/Chilomastix_caulleri/1708:80-523(+)